MLKYTFYTYTFATIKAWRKRNAFAVTFLFTFLNNPGTFKQTNKPDINIIYERNLKNLNSMFENKF